MRSQRTEQRIASLRPERPSLYQPRAERSAALGFVRTQTKALKGRNNFLNPPFQGLIGFSNKSQGVALGWINPAPSALNWVPAN
jgi:hypothetical protein